MSKGILDLLFDSIFDENWVGRRGEKLTARELKFAQLLGKKGKILRNVYLPKDNGETSELDVIFITQKGIIIFESKNYSGWIFGDEKSRNWTAMLPNRQKNQFYNPIMQNKTHLKWMRNYVGEGIPLYSIIVFSERCELKKVTVTSPDVRVIKRDRTYAAVRDIWEQNPDAVSDDMIEELYTMLSALTHVDAAVKAAHIADIERKYKPGADGKRADIVRDASWSKVEEPIRRTDAEPDAIHALCTSDEPANKIVYNQKSYLCPKCLNELVLRTVKSGKNAGKQFWGCSAYPECRYTEPVDDSGSAPQSQSENTSANHDQDPIIAEFINDVIQEGSLNDDSADTLNNMVNQNIGTETSDPVEVPDNDAGESSIIVSVPENKKENMPETHESINNVDMQAKICPKCGREMVLRTARKGANAGKQFWGCAGYPKCRTIINI